MKILVLVSLTKGRTVEDMMPFVAEEARAVWELMKKDVVRAISYRADKPGAVLEMEVPDVESAKEAIARLPAVKAGIIEAESVIPLTPYTGFEALFATK